MRLHPLQVWPTSLEDHQRQALDLTLLVPVLLPPLEPVYLEAMTLGRLDLLQAPPAVHRVL